MNALHLTLATYDENSGVVKKIKAQAKAIQKNGFERVFVGMIDEDLWLDVDGGKIGRIQSVSNLRGQSQFFKKLENFIINNDIKFIYYRFNAASEPSIIRFFNKMRKSGIKCVMEIPTYPYDRETKNKNRLTYMDIFTRRFLAGQFNYIVTFSEDKKIFGKQTINISNGVDFSIIPTKGYQSHDDFVMIGVANLMYWHGFDRVIMGLKGYQNGLNNRNVKFIIVSGKENDYVMELKNIVNNLGLQEIVRFKGEVSGADLDELFNQCDIAIGSLARHRNGIAMLKTLKNVEYAARGIPFIYSEDNPDFDDMPYVMKVPADESPIDIQSVIDFAQSVKLTPEEIRATVKHLSWDNQMKKVVDAINILPCNDE